MSRSTSKSPARSHRSTRIAGGPAGRYDELTITWRAAQEDAADAYRIWSSRPGRDAFAAYRAAQDRADAAQEALAAARSR